MPVLAPLPGNADGLGDRTGYQQMRSWLAAIIVKAALGVGITIATSIGLLPVDAWAFQLDDDQTGSSTSVDSGRLASIPRSVADWVRESIWSIGHTKRVPRPGECEYGAAPGCGYAAWQWFGSRPNAVYEGEYRDGAPNGHGVYSWSDGARYEGEFREGKFQGHGTFIWANGTRYEGEWSNGAPDGEGRLSTARHVYAGVWADGCFRQGRASMAVGRNASSCPIAAKARQFKDFQNNFIVGDTSEQGQFSALFACVQAGRQANAMCISEMSGPSGRR